MLTLSPNRPHTTFAPPTIPVAPALGRAFDEAWHHHGTDTDERLMDATFALVKRLKGLDLPPEKVLVAVKTALTKYAELHLTPSLDGDDDASAGGDRTILYRRVFEWFLEAYYGEQA
jgi:hypothetical protein